MTKFIYVKLGLATVGLLLVIVLVNMPISVMAPLGQVLNPGTGVWVNVPPPGVGCHSGF